MRWLGHSSPSFLVVQSPRSRVVRALDRVAQSFFSFVHDVIIFQWTNHAPAATAGRLYFRRGWTSDDGKFFFPLNRRPAIVLAGSIYFLFFLFRSENRPDELIASSFQTLRRPKPKILKKIRRPRKYFLILLKWIRKMSFWSLNEKI
jgi:hypothetical protein